MKGFSNSLVGGLFGLHQDFFLTRFRSMVCCVSINLDVHAGLHTGVLAGEGREVLGSKFFACHTHFYLTMLLMQYYFTSWKIAPGVHGVLDKIK